MTNCPSSAALHRWLEKANPGERAIYHVGHLAADREKIFAGQRSIFPCNNIGLTALSEYDKGTVELTQRRRPKARDFEYIITKRKYIRRTTT